MDKWSVFFTYLSKAYGNGLLFYLEVFGDVIELSLVSTLFVPRMAKFLGKLSMAEAMLYV